MVHECEVYEPLALVLRLSRLAGVAPVRLVSRSDRLFVQYSFAFDICGRLGFGCLVPGGFIAFIWYIIATGKAKEILFQMMPVAVTFTISVVIVIFSSTCAVFKNPQRMNDLIENMMAIQRVKFTKQHNVKTQTKIIVTIIYLTLLSILLCLDMWAVILTEDSEDYNPIAIIRMSLYCIGYAVMVFCNMQFIFVASELVYVFHTVNQQLEITTTELEKTHVHSSSAIRSASMTIHILADAYLHLCNIVRKMDREQGISLILTLTLFIMFFEVSGFLLVMCIVNQPVNTLGVKLENNFFDVSLQVAWCLFHSISAILLMEPCQRTLSEMEKTKVLVIKLMYKTSHLGAALNNDLEIFLTLIVTNSTSYSPLKLVTIDRPLALKLIGGLVSYLFIILQFNLKG